MAYPPPIRTEALLREPDRAIRPEYDLKRATPGARERIFSNALIGAAGADPPGVPLN
jgi:hypothetical protein